MDVKSIQFGVDFVTEINRVIASSEVVVALIGPNWAVSREGHRRLDDPDDLVRREVAAAMAAAREGRTRLIPVIAANARVPSDADLPDDLIGLRRINAVQLSTDYYDESVKRVVTSVAVALESTLDRAEESRGVRPLWTSDVDRPEESLAVESSPTDEAPVPTAASPLTPGAPTPPREHFDSVAQALRHDRLAVFVGPGINLAGRQNGGWAPTQNGILPSLSELAAYLAEAFRLSDVLGARASEFEVVADHVETLLGSRPLYEELHNVLSFPYAPTAVHRMMARIPSLLRNGGSNGALLSATTNYDDTLEQAFEEAGETFDVVAYAAAGDARGRFLHYPPGSDPVLVEEPQTYTGVTADERPVILKLLGSIDRARPENDSFVVSPEDQLDYLSRGATGHGLPVLIASQLLRSSVVFLGVSPEPRIFRTALRRTVAERLQAMVSWAVQVSPTTLDRELWRRWNVQPYSADYIEYADSLAKALESSPGIRGTSA
jgi:SIR2-like domain/TIR domain